MIQYRRDLYYFLHNHFFYPCNEGEILELLPPRSPTWAGRNILLTRLLLHVFQILVHGQCQPVILSFRLAVSLSRLHTWHLLNRTQPCHHLTATTEGSDPAPEPLQETMSATRRRREQRGELWKVKGVGKSRKAVRWRLGKAKREINFSSFSMEMWDELSARMKRMRRRRLRKCLLFKLHFPAGPD